MADSILFRFLDGDTCEWSPVRQPAEPVQRGSLRDLASACSGRRAVLVADGAEITLTQAHVPSRQRSTVMRAVPYALEDRFAEDIEALHFAVGDRQEDGWVRVAVVRHEVMQDWRKRCFDAGISLAEVVPELLFLPHVEGGWSLLGDGNRILVRTGAWSGFVTDREAAPVYLDLALRQAGEDKPDSLHLFGELDPAEVRLSSQLNVVKAESPMTALQVYAQQDVPYAKFSLLQGIYKHGAEIGRMFRPWRVAAILAAVIVLLQFGLNVTQQVKLESLARDYTAEMERIYRETFPDARKVVNPRVQMDRRLAELRRGTAGGDGGVLALMSRAGPVVKATPGLKIDGLNYRNGDMILTISADSLERVDQLRGRLLEAGELQVELQSASSREGQVNSRLLIRRAS